MNVSIYSIRRTDLSDCSIMERILTKEKTHQREVASNLIGLISSTDQNTQQFALYSFLKDGQLIGVLEGYFILHQFIISHYYMVKKYQNFSVLSKGLKLLCQTLCLTHTNITEVHFMVDPTDLYAQENAEIAGFQTLVDDEYYVEFSIAL